MCPIFVNQFFGSFKMLALWHMHWFRVFGWIDKNAYVKCVGTDKKCDALIGVWKKKSNVEMGFLKWMWIFVYILEVQFEWIHIYRIHRMQIWTTIVCLLQFFISWIIRDCYYIYFCWHFITVILFDSINNEKKKKKKKIE